MRAFLLACRIEQAVQVFDWSTGDVKDLDADGQTRYGFKHFVQKTKAAARVSGRQAESSDGTKAYCIKSHCGGVYFAIV